ncbi:MAG: energy transducer TonB [Bacteroidales bacterium]|nr:energy transducer TonB [Bacteroidales bacterium]
MGRFLFSLAFIMTACLELNAQFITTADNDRQGFVYDKAHVEGNIAGKSYYGTVDGFSVMHMRNDQSYSLDASCEDWTVSMILKLKESYKGTYVYTGKCRIVTGSSVNPGYNTVKVTTKAPMERFAWNTGISSKLADSLVAENVTLANRREAIRVECGTSRMAIVPVTRKSRGRFDVEYVDCPMPEIGKGVVLELSDVNMELYRKCAGRISSTIRGCVKDYIDDGMLVSIVDSVFVDRKGATTHNIQVKDFVPDNPELKEKVLEVLNEIRFLPLELKNEGEQEGTLADYQQVFNINIINPTEKPKFKGGSPNDFSKWVNARLKYPGKCRQECIEGRVMLKFIVDTDGHLVDIEVLDSPHQLLADEACRVVRSSPKWSPAKVGKIPIRMSFTFPVIFDLGR